MLRFKAGLRAIRMGNSSSVLTRSGGGGDPSDSSKDSEEFVEGSVERARNKDEEEQLGVPIVRKKDEEERLGDAPEQIEELGVPIVRKKDEEERLGDAPEQIEEEQLGDPPEKPLPGDCCGSGCERCVWDLYYEELDDYNKRKKDLEERSARNKPE